MLLFIFILVAGACAVAVFRWRWGVFAAIVVGLLQDPLRKMVPGVPGYLAMCSVPVWITTLLMALASGEVSAHNFLSGFPRLSRWVSVFGLYLLIPAALSLTYGKGSWQITLLGMIVYLAAFYFLAVGFRFPGSPTSINHVLAFYAIGAGMILVGGPLDYFGLAEGVAAIGTEAMDMVWVTHRTGEALFMYTGFFRSPDVMGWHAALVIMLSVLMAAHSRGWIRAFWIALAVWGFLNLWICGRRKMVAMLPVFGGLMLLFAFRFRGVGRMVSMAGLLLIVVGVGWFGVTRTYHATAIDTFYGSTMGDLDDRVVGHGIKAVVGTVQQAGFWGYGLGMAQQGVHHIHAEKPRLWQEGGPGKIFAELGVPGAILFLCLSGVLLATTYQIVGRLSDSSSFYIYAGLLSILGSNMASAVVSAQIFGDLFITLFLAFMTGMLLSGVRVVRLPAEDVASKVSTVESGW